MCKVQFAGITPYLDVSVETLLFFQVSFITVIIITYFLLYAVVEAEVSGDNGNVHKLALTSKKKIVYISIIRVALISQLLIYTYELPFLRWMSLYRPRPFQPTFFSTNLQQPSF